MKVEVKFFARYREIVGSEDVDLELDDGTTVVSLIARLVEKYPEFPSDPHMAAVNAEYVEPDVILNDGDEVAFFPPFSGG